VEKLAPPKFWVIWTPFGSLKVKNIETLSSERKILLLNPGSGNKREEEFSLQLLTLGIFHYENVFCQMLKTHIVKLLFSVSNGCFPLF
jgi:hypothetical protein